jgi:hypothetical protein
LSRASAPGAICPKDGKGVGLVLPGCNTEAMDLHLQEIAAQIAPRKDAALLVDQAGCHMSREFCVPANITIIPSPPRRPELNPTENVWRFIRGNWLSNVSSRPTTTCSIIAARLGTSASINLGASCP